MAIIKAGGCYVPLDTSYPGERLAFMLRDTGTPLLLTQNALAGQVSLPCGVTELTYEEIERQACNESSGNLPHVAGAENCAYVMYTSGSTGQPKGIQILHRGVVSLVSNAEYATLTPQDRVAQMSNCAFDASTWEIWGALLSGARLVGIGKEVALSPQALVSAIRTEGITSMFMTTALFLLMAKEAPTAFRGMRNLLTGGEAMSTRWMREVLAHGAPQRLVHVYGPTEGTAFATWHLVQEVAEDATSVPIGKALQNSRAYVLDGELRPVGDGETGELHISGDGLARGYLYQPEMTAQRFVSSPHLPGERLYKTGDLVRPLPCGALDFVGRADLQVKIRGFRIELGEIQAALRMHPVMSDVAVLVHEPEHGDKRLVAYMVAKDRNAAMPQTATLRAYLKNSLPAYMIPGAFVWLSAMPLTVNGKVDRAALLAMNPMAFMEHGDYSAPETETEVTVAKALGKLLGMARPSRSDNFLRGRRQLAARHTTGSPPRRDFPRLTTHASLLHQPYASGTCTPI